MSYGLVHGSFWTDEKVRSWPDDAKMLAMYFITGPHRNILGCSRIPNGYIAEDMGWDAKRLARALGTLVDTLFIMRDEDGWTLVVNQLKYDPIKHTNHLTGAIKLLKAVPTKSPIYPAIYERLASNAKAMGKPLDIPSPGPVDPVVTSLHLPTTPTPTPTPNTNTAPDGAQTVREPLVAILGEELADGVIDHRKRLRKPLTALAAKLLAGKFESCPDPPAAAQAMIANGWQGIEPSWMKPNVKPNNSRASDFAADVLEVGERLQRSRELHERPAPDG